MPPGCTAAGETAEIFDLRPAGKIEKGLPEALLLIRIEVLLNNMLMNNLTAKTLLIINTLPWQN